MKTTSSSSVMNELFHYEKDLRRMLLSSENTQEVKCKEEDKNFKYRNQ